MHPSLRQYLPSRAVCNRYNICTRTLFRWREAPKLNFPQGIEINGRRYFDSDELDDWDRMRRDFVTAAVPATLNKHVGQGPFN